MGGFAVELIIYLLSSNIDVPANNGVDWAKQKIDFAYSQAENVGEQLPNPRREFENWCRAIIRYNNLAVSHEENRLELEESETSQM